jgi:hypothetical protein
MIKTSSDPGLSVREKLKKRLLFVSPSGNLRSCYASWHRGGNPSEMAEMISGRPTDEWLYSGHVLQVEPVPLRGDTSA